MSVLIIADHDNKHLNENSKRCVSAGLQLSQSVDLIVMGYECEHVAESASKLVGVSRVITIEAEHLQHQLAEEIVTQLLPLAAEYDYLLTPAGTTGKNLLPRLAALLDVQPVSEVTKIIDAETFEHPIYAGNVIATVKLTEAKKLLTIRTTAFDAVAAADAPCDITSLDALPALELSEYVGEQLAQSDRPDLAAAPVVISGGRGMQNAENFQLLYDLADKLNGAVGASRAAVDAGYVPNDMQVGQTGKIVAPDLYIAAGISGAIQHLAGMKESKVIVAINKDEDAPIFQVADYGLVADLFEVLPELTQKLG